MRFIKSIFSYTDYRCYLNDYYCYNKQNTPGFSFQSMSIDAGFISNSNIVEIINGHKTLSFKRVFNVATSMGLGGKEIEYFENMVKYSLAKSDSEKNHYYNLLESVSFENKSQNLNHS